MATPYSNDRRERVVGSVERGGSSRRQGVALAAMPTEAAACRETVSAEWREAVAIVPMIEVPIMLEAVEVVDAAKTEAERVVGWIVGISLVSAGGVGVGKRAIIRRCGTPRKDKPDTHQEWHCSCACSAAVHRSLHYVAVGRPPLTSEWARPIDAALRSSAVHRTSGGLRTQRDVRPLGLHSLDVGATSGGQCKMFTARCLIPPDLTDGGSVSRPANLVAITGR